MNRNRMVVGALGLVVGAGAVGWIAGSTITSPADAASRAQAPEASLITAAVESRVLSADVIARGNINYSDPVSLTLSGAIGETGQTQIATMVPEVGTPLPEGSVAIEVSGRPVLLLQGDLPVYRDLRPGSSGDDVAQLEESLVRLGFLASADDVWGVDTGAAIQRLYAAAGYSANTTSAADQDAIDAARDSVRVANQALQDAKKALQEAGGATGSDLIAAQAAVTQAQSDLTAAQAARTAAVGAANGDLAVAEQALDDAYPGGAPSPVTADYTALLADVTDATNNVASVTAQQNSLVLAAQNALSLAQARLTEAQTPGDKTGLIRARDDAQRQLAEANEQLAEVQKKAGTWIPAGEIIFLKNFPVQVAQTNVQRGSTVSGPFMTVSGATVAMTVGISQDDAARLSVGDTVIIDEPDLLTEPVEAEITEIPDSPTADRIQMVVQLESVPQELLGANVRVVIPVKSTDGEVLVVPAAALSAVANGDVRVEVEDPDNPGTTRYVTVVTGLATDGVVEVRPIEGSLKKGDRVVVGQADIGPAEGSSTTEPSESATDDGEG